MFSHRSFSAVLIKAALAVLLLATAVPIQAGQPEQTAVFVSGEQGYHTYRIPSLIVTKKATLLAFCEGRKKSRGDSGDIDLVLKRSFDGGKTWGKIQVVWDDGDNTCGNPCPVIDGRTGAIWLLLTHNLGSDTEAMILDGTSKGTRTVWAARSDDDGATWRRPVEITRDVKKSSWTWYATGPGVGIQLKNGRLVVPCDNHVAGSKVQQSHVIISDDGGQTWKLGGVVGPHCDESQVVELSDGSLMLNIRSYRGTNRRLVAISKDRGGTFSEPVEDPALIEPVCQASIMRYPGGAGGILFSNPASTKREKMTVRLSRDEGKTWPVAKVLHNGPAAYSCLAVLGDGNIGCLYERGRNNPYETITFARFPLDWLRDSPLPAKGIKLAAVEHVRKAIYHSPATPGFTCWVGAWKMPDEGLMVCFTQATGPLKDRPRAPKEIQKRLSWPPAGDARYDMTGLDLKNVHLRSTDHGATWKEVSADSFQSPMNGVTGECATALRDGTVLRGVWGFYLPYNPELPQTGFLQRSSDGTRTWSKPEVLLDAGKFTCWPRRLRQLRDGRLLLLGGLARVPANSRTREDYGALLEPCLLISADAGKSWTGPINVVPLDQRKSWTEEWDAAELANGDLLCVFRRPDPKTRREVRWQGLLKKNGQSWVPLNLGPAPFAHSGHPELLATREGVVLNVATTGIHWTADAGKSWTRLNVPGSSYYPRSLQATDGRIHVFSHVGGDDPYGAVDQAIVTDTFRLVKE